MKTKKKLPKKYLSIQDSDLLERLINSVKKRYTIKDIVFMFLDKLDGYEERNEMVEELMKDENVEENLKRRLKSEMTTDGFIVLKVDTLDKRERLNDFIDTLYPYYNDQQNLFNS